MSTSTSDTLIRIGQKLFLEGGYHHAGVQQVLKEAGVPKGSFYHYFDSKEDFGLRVIDAYFDTHQVLLERHLSDTSMPPLKRLERYFDDLTRSYQEQEWRGGCLLGTLSQELADQSEAFRSRLGTYFTAWRDRLADCLREAQEVGDLRKQTDADMLADFCLNSWEGAVMQMKVQKNGEPLKAFQTLIFRSLLAR